MLCALGFFEKMAQSSFPFISEKSMYTLVTVLRSLGNQHTYLFVIDDSTATHSRLTPTQDMQQGVNAFLKKYEFSHNNTLAQQGKNILKQALQQ